MWKKSIFGYLWKGGGSVYNNIDNTGKVQGKVSGVDLIGVFMLEHSEVNRFIIHFSLFLAPS